MFRLSFSTRSDAFSGAGLMAVIAVLTGLAGCAGQPDTPRTIVPAAAPTAAADTGTTQAARSEPRAADAAADANQQPAPPSPLAQAAQNISDELATRLRSAIETAAMLEKIRSAGQTDRIAASDLLRNMIESTPDILGVSTVWQPDAYDGRDAEFATADLQNPDTGQFVVYWARGADGTIRQSKVNHTALVAKGSWLSPMTTGNPYVSEPYSFAVANVSYVAATISAPILDPTGISPEPLGVFSIDVPLNSVGASLRAGDLPKGARIVLVDRNNDLAADSDPAWQPGSGISAPGEPFATYLVESRGDPTMKLSIEWANKEYELAVAPVTFNGDQRIWRLMMLTPVD